MSNSVELKIFTQEKSLHKKKTFVIFIWTAPKADLQKHIVHMV